LREVVRTLASQKVLFFYRTTAGRAQVIIPSKVAGVT
jgi:hypothetical protein